VGEAVRRCLILIAVCFSLAACDQRPKLWQAFVYPDANALTRVVEMGSFETFEQCQQAAIEGLRTLGLAEVGDYECGYRCRRQERYGGVNVCKETRQ